MIKHQTRITTNINSQLLMFVDKMAKEREVTRREVIEDSIKKLEREAKGRAITESYNRMAEDKEEMDMWFSIANNPVNLEW
ncbi:MAG: hypothetical protein WC764_00980 [Candidatus Paceibacterota bacterium]|jgi:metal-responsive CopG/Arc/MetJ family transcriptional regulator